MSIGKIIKDLALNSENKRNSEGSFAASMTLSFVLVGIGFLTMVFTAPETKWLYLVYTCLHSFAMAGINSGVVNLVYDYVGPSERAVAMGVKNALGGILGFLIALLSGSILGKIQEAGGFNLFGITLYAQQVLAFISFVCIVVLIFYMRIVIAPMEKVSVNTEND